MYYGDIELGDTIRFPFTTVDAAGVPIVLAGSPVLSAYVDGGTTELTTGVSVSVSHDARVGLNMVTVVATSGNSFAKATNVAIVITTGTIDGASAIGYAVGHFSIENRGLARVRRAESSLVLVTASGTPTTTNIPTSSIDPAATVTDQFKTKILTFDKDTDTPALRGQSTDITGSTAGGVLTVTALTTAPASGDTGIIS